MPSDIQHTPNLSRVHLPYKSLMGGDKWSRVTFGRVYHFEKTALILPIRVIYFHFKVHTNCGLLQHTRLVAHSPKKSFEVNHNLLTLSLIARSSISSNRNAGSRFGQPSDISPRIWCICCSAGPLLE